MIKVSLLATLFAGLAMGGSVAVNSSPKEPEKRDTQIIVEVNRSLGSLTEEGVKNVQNSVYSTIKQYVTPNIKLISSYSVLNNAFAISVNSKYVESIKSLPGVKSVTVNKLHYFTQSTSRTVSEDPDPEHDYGGKDNASAETMHLEEGTTNDGEGTVIAILDNEFYFRAPFKEGTSLNQGFKHETFTDFTEEENVKVRWESRPDITKTHAYLSTDDDGNYRWKDTIDATPLGQEGSLYFSKKIPYYFDYGGDPNYYGADPDEDFDVSSLRDYHGSHVSSIAAGHSPYYKGIAPKAQLVCMKVFTNFKASKTDLALGFNNASGAYDIPLLNALEDCITLGVDGINMSLGSNLDDFDAESISMKTLNRLYNAGILSSISAGNAGKTSYGFAGGYGNWTKDMVETGILGGYANQADSMVIAAGQPARTFYASAFDMGGINVSYQDQVVNVGDSTDYDDDQEHRISDLITSESTTLGWVYIPNFGSGSDYAGKNVTGKIAVVNRGSIDFSTKVKTAKEKGAIGVVIINNDPTASDFNFRCSFGEYKPPIPVALVLFKDKAKFSENAEGQGFFNVIKNKVDVNPKANKISDFSSDGAAASLDLKPDITAPGDSIRGAVPPQSKEDKVIRPYSTYEFLSGTSMSAPNYAGAQSVVLSKRAVELKDDPVAYNEYRKTVDMRLMSTAIPMVDYDDCPEDGHAGNDPINGYRTSPRLQGAGMANIGDAYNTSVYLEGLDLFGNPINKSKIALRNSSKINQGIVSLKFLAHNESNEDKTYSASFTVMRPAIKQSNEIVGRNYNDCHEIDSYANFPGRSYWERFTDSSGVTKIIEKHTSGIPQVGNVYHVTREIKYNDLDKDPVTGEDTLVERVIPIGRYCCTDIIDERIDPETGDTWVYAQYEVFESSSYQSTQDILIKTSAPVTVTAKANDKTLITLPELSLTQDEKDKILEFYTYGTYLEGYITLTSQNGDNINLSMPWMGFFAGEGQDYHSAPLAEPFGFEKDSSTIYPSELVNDLGYSLLGKTNIDLGSTWVTTYVEPGKEFDYDKILSNDESLTHLAEVDSKFHLLGTDSEGKYYDNASNELYVGNPLSSNTMIIQQFMLRSVNDNYFTITNKASGKVVGRDVLKDMLFGERYGRFPLYKSHADSNYLGGGYISHRAYAQIALYYEDGTPFEPGDYEITFNYQLAADNTWITKSYTLHVLSSEPSVSNVYVLPDGMRFYFNEKNIASIKVGKHVYDDEMSEAEKKGNYIFLSYDRIKKELQENLNPVNESGRLFIEVNNKAYGKTGILIRFRETVNGIDFKTYTITEHNSFIFSNDFEDLGNEVIFYKVSGTQAKRIDVSDGYLRIKRSNEFKTPEITVVSSGCGGNIAATSIILSALAGALAILIIVARKKHKGGKA